MYELTCHSDNRTADRKDQAIGRVVAMLPLLPVKELDALADRLNQKIRTNPGLPANPDRPAASSSAPVPAARPSRDPHTTEQDTDLVGQ